MNSPSGRARSAVSLVAAAAAGALILLASGSAAYAQRAPVDGTPDIDASITARNWSGALAQLDKRIAANPHDVQAQFKRGTVLARLGRDDEAIDQFHALTQAYPELPEPYNNLAALYAKHGRYDEARAALVTATQANPNYTLAYENLGDLYLRLASTSYKHAQQLGHTSGATTQRLADIDRVINGRPDKSPPPGTPDSSAPAPVSNTLLPLSPTFQFGGPSGPLSVPYAAPSN